MSQRRLPPEIYWRRRLLALALLILLVWVVLQVVSHLRNGSSGSDSSAATTPTPSVAPTTPVATNGVVSATLTSSTTACDPEKIVVTPAVAAGQHSGGAVKVQMSIGTTQTTACTFDAKKADLLVVISANKSPIWDSSVCKAAFVPGTVSISPRWSTVVNTTWSGRGSGTKCSASEGFASAGTYVLKTATLGGEPGQTTFHLTTRPKPTTKPSATPTTKSTTKPTSKPTTKPTATSPSTSPND